ncbi:MAG TPA: HD-GYP domain-containing protein [Gaiellaceae bacterium]|nr:HD-GYP domain-containing protein [Gaiellaceae bacterium]
MDIQDLTLTAGHEGLSSLASDELTRDARDRVEQGRLEFRARSAFAAVAIAFVVVASLSAAFLLRGPHFSWPIAVLFVVLYAIVSRVEFEIGTGAAIPTELILVPMLFALPVGAVPGLVAFALVAGALANRSSPISVDRVILLIASASQTLGPALVIALGGGTPLRWSAWPIYLAALASQFIVDFGAAGVTSVVGHGLRWRTLSQFLTWVFIVDAALAPIGLAIAFATRGHNALVVGVLPLVFLLRHFSLERQRRIDNALELSDAYRGTAFLLGDVVEADDHYTGAHSRHVVELVVAVCEEIGLGPAARRDAEFVALLHDVGKIRIPPEIINKAGPLNDDERELINTHTIEGERMLEQVGGLLGHVGRLVRSCHEHWDGNGYPDGLAGEAIPLVARIVTTCDAFSAMTTDRSYRGALSHEEALAELERCAGTQFDPRVVKTLALVASKR